MYNLPLINVFRSLSVCILIAAVSGCATTVTSVSKDDAPVLNGDEGYLFIGIDTDTPLEGMRFVGAKFIELTSQDLRRGNNYLLVNLPAGEYKLESIKVRSPYKFKFFEKDKWSFDVKPGVISYVGHIEFRSALLYGWAANLELVNQASVGLEYLEQNYANLLSAYDIEYQGPGSDLFFMEVMSASTEVVGNE